MGTRKVQQEGETVVTIRTRRYQDLLADSGCLRDLYEAAGHEDFGALMRLVQRSASRKGGGGVASENGRVRPHGKPVVKPDDGPPLPFGADT